MEKPTPEQARKELAKLDREIEAVGMEVALEGPDTEMKAAQSPHPAIHKVEDRPAA